MAEEVKPDTIKKTQAALNKYIKKPPLSDKLLKKPPFRFLHDIVTSVIKETGFLKGVFTTDELVADNVKDRDGKIKFLTKLINAVKDATGSQIKAKPGKIVAGLEPDKTLELLQAIAKGISLQNNGKKLPATQAKAKSNKESSKTTSKEPIEENGKDLRTDKTQVEEAPTKTEGETPEKTSLEDQPAVNGVAHDTEEEEVKEKKKKKERRNSAVQDVENEGKEKRRRSAREKKEKEEGRIRESFPPTPVIVNGNRGEEVEDKGEKQVNGITDEPPPRRKSSSRLKKEVSTESQEKIDISLKISEDTDIEIRNNGLENGVTEIESKSRTKVEVIEEKTEDNKKRSRSKSSSGKSAKETENKNDSIDKKDDDESVNKKESGSGDTTLQKRPTTRRNSTRASRQPLKALVEKDGKNEIKEDEGEVKADSKGEVKKKTEKVGPITLGNSDVIAPAPLTAPLERPMTARRAPPSARPGSARPPSARPRSMRPPSALPGVPTARDRGEVDVDINKDPSDAEIKEVALITENEKIEDKEEMVVMENESLALNEDESITREDNSSVMEGVLVDNILETQSELEKKKMSRPQVGIEWEGGSKEKREAWQKECERLRHGVQALTRASGPLGKLFDFLQEDVDLAARELTSWRQASKNYTSQLTSEERLTEETLSRHRKKLAELDTLIEEQHDAIRSTKASIISNDKKIQAIISRPNTAR